jgi:hypothetical protein
MILSAVARQSLAVKGIRREIYFMLLDKIRTESCLLFVSLSNSSNQAIGYTGSA